MKIESLVVGIAGEAGSGKDTVCDYLVSEHNFTKLAMAGPLKEIVSKVFPLIPREHLYGPSPLRSIPNSEYPLAGACMQCGSAMKMTGGKWVCRCGFSHGPSLTPRLALQTLGTEWGRRLYEDVWVDYLFSEVRSRPVGKFCISDSRFPNEVNRTNENGGITIRLKRKKLVEPKRNPMMKDLFSKMFGKASKEHASETSLDSLPPSAFHTTIVNDGTIPELFESVDKAIRSI